jgi:hypothetical protein
MKISEFIGFLTSIQEEHGDLDVMEYSYNDWLDKYDHTNMNQTDFEVQDLESGIVNRLILAYHKVKSKQ